MSKQRDQNLTNRLSRSFDNLGYRELQKFIEKSMSMGLFQMWLQPKVISSGELYGYEALARWCYDDIVMFPQENKIKKLKQSGIFIQLGDYLIDDVISSLEKLKDLNCDLVPVSINITTEQIDPVSREDKGLQPFQERVFQKLNEKGLESRLIQFEVLETSNFLDDKNGLNVLQELKEMGFEISIDDYGQGNNNSKTLGYSYYDNSGVKKRLFGDLKIDRYDVQTLGTEDFDMSFWQNLLVLKHQYGVRLIAEGVETMDQIIFLRDLKSDYQEINDYLHQNNQAPVDAFQGWYYSKAIPFGDELVKQFSENYFKDKN